MRERAAGSLLFFGIAAVFVIGVAWGRAGYVPEIGIPLRYVSIALPVFLAGYLLLVGSQVRGLQFVPRALALAMVLLLPINTRAGDEFFANWYSDGMRMIERDLERGARADELAVKHQRFLVHWWTPAELERHMRMLQNARIGPFGRAPSAP